MSLCGSSIQGLLHGEDLVGRDPRGKFTPCPPNTAFPGFFQRVFPSWVEQNPPQMFVWLLRALLDSSFPQILERVLVPTNS